MFRILFLIGAGSFVGGVLRYLSQQFIQQHFPSSIPLGTLAVNAAGCFIIGVIYALTGKGLILSPELRLLLATGFCGGYTTFSSFAYENVALLQESDFFYSTLYIALSVLVGLVAVYAGTFVIKLIH